MGVAERNARTSAVMDSRSVFADKPGSTSSDPANRGWYDVQMIVLSGLAPC